MNGATHNYAYWPGPGGSTVLEQTGGYYYFQHKDWLNNARISSSVAGQGIIDDRAFAPYGEMYNNFGSTAQNELEFTGLTQDILTGIYDSPNREFAGYNQGRWLTPDPAGAGWNQYAYPANPNSFADPTGLVCTDVVSRGGPKPSSSCPVGDPEGAGDDGPAFYSGPADQFPFEFGLPNRLWVLRRRHRRRCGCGRIVRNFSR
jgi:RHS repeat-associated protein